ncbi:MAG: hypothetical protein A3G34_15205 [Candidatus Lindowbacteria bacterium RIFCSPLOWO2_12_FULL_62_27]|nr:MAG: hypothetical protein A3G34_15205 [Candidatus Lindowbacteria bacterium RIFCSPLOWO2_12_FULL_62_27]OGH63872.1 MAG: hypothetical protein A3I06_06185 [Candidatus Lindowbacteria bacterium RIFCSPLOWO2_02_FULL_62_12]
MATPNLDEALRTGARAALDIFLKGLPPELDEPVIFNGGGPTAPDVFPERTPPAPPGASSAKPAQTAASPAANNQGLGMLVIVVGLALLAFVAASN